LRYYRISASRGNITGEVVRGSYLASAEREWQQLEIKPKRSIKRRSLFQVSGSSTSLSPLFARIEIQVRRK